MSTKKILKAIAKKNNVSVAEVKRNMREAIHISMLCHPERSDLLWSRLSPDGKEPSIEVFLKFCTEKVTKRMG